MAKSTPNPSVAAAWRARFAFQTSSTLCLAIHFGLIFTGMLALYWAQMGGPFTQDEFTRSLSPYVGPSAVFHRWGGLLYLATGLMAAWTLWLTGLRLRQGRWSAFTVFALLLALVVLGSALLSHASGLVATQDMEPVSDAAMRSSEDLLMLRTDGVNKAFDVHMRYATILQLICAVLLVYTNLLLRTARWKRLSSELAEEGARS